jgi:hypothetical protein
LSYEFWQGILINVEGFTMSIAGILAFLILWFVDQTGRHRWLWPLLFLWPTVSIFFGGILGKSSKVQLGAKIVTMITLFWVILGYILCIIFRIPGANKFWYW